MWYTNNLEENAGKRIKILHGCSFEGWPNRAWPVQPQRVEWLCPIRSDLKRTTVLHFNSFFIMFHYIFSTTYQKLGDPFYPVIFLDFCVWFPYFQTSIFSFFSILAWAERPTITISESMNYPIEKIIFPSVTLCPNSNPDRWGPIFKIFDGIRGRCKNQSR